MKTKTPTEYDKARDEYGTMSKDQRSKVLDRVSQKTNMQIGPEAEQAFIDSVKEIKEEDSNNSYFGMIYIP